MMKHNTIIIKNTRKSHLAVGYEFSNSVAMLSMKGAERVIYVLKL